MHIKFQSPLYCKGKKDRKTKKKKKKDFDYVMKLITNIDLIGRTET